MALIALLPFFSQGLRIYYARRMTFLTRPWCNGSTSGSDPEDRGSKPCGRISFVLLILLSCAACAPKAHIEDPILIDVESEPTKKMDKNVEVESQAMHHFMVGELKFGADDIDGAISELAQASALEAGSDPFLHYTLAQLYLRAGKLEKAFEESSKSLAAAPQSTESRILQAGILEALGRESEAVPLYESVLQDRPEQPEVYLLLANIYIRGKNFPATYEILRRLQEKTPEAAIANYYVGRAQEVEGKLQEAEQSYRKAVDATPQNTVIPVDLIRVLLKLKKIEAAKLVCRKLLAKDPNNLNARRVLGQLSLGESNYDEALEHLRVLEDVEEDSVDARFKIALIQLEKRNVAEATRELSLVLAANPAHDKARYYLGSVYAGEGKTKEALEELLKIEKGAEMYVNARTFAAVLYRQEKNLAQSEQMARDAYEADPQNKSVASYLIAVLRDAKKFSEAERLLLEAIGKEPQNERLLFHYAVLLDEMERESEAMQQMEQVIAINPRHAEALNYVAYHLSKRGENLDKAEEYVTAALHVKPRDGYFLDTLGWIHFQRGDLAKAVLALETAVKYSGNDPLILEHYADALAASGRMEEAKNIYRKALEVPVEANADADEAKTIAERVKGKLENLETAAGKL